LWTHPSNLEPLASLTRTQISSKRRQDLKSFRDLPRFRRTYVRDSQTLSPAPTCSEMMRLPSRKEMAKSTMLRE
jgi:hypothetical protein